MTIGANRKTEKKPKNLKPTMPAWLLSRQLDKRLSAHAVLPEGITSDQLTAILDEENEYDDPYSPELIEMLNSVDRAFVCYLNEDPVFFREIFEPWYLDTLAPHIFNHKLPVEPPPIATHRDNGNIFLIVILVVAVLTAILFLANLFPHLLPYIHKFRLS